MDHDKRADRPPPGAVASQLPTACRRNHAEATPRGRAAPAFPPWVPRWLPPEEQRDFEAIARRGRSALAWEVLRRDPAYRAARAVMPEPVADAAADGGFAARWGLHFP